MANKDTEASADKAILCHFECLIQILNSIYYSDKSSQNSGEIQTAFTEEKWAYDADNILYSS